MNKPLNALLISGVSLLWSSLAAQAALELYTDFETPLRGVKATGGSEVVGRFYGEKLPDYIAESPASLAGRSKKALHFGGGFAVFQTADAPELGEEWSINVFVKFDTKVAARQTLLGRPGSWFWYADPARKTVTFTPKGTDKPLTFPLPANAAGQWQMFTLTKAGNNIEFFVNGKAQGKRELSAPLEPTGALYIGASSSKATYAVHAALDDLSVWSQVLTPAQIQKLYTGTPAPEIAAAGRLKRMPTPPITAQTPVYPLKTKLDAGSAVIVAPETAGGTALAEKVRAALAKAWGVQLQVRNVANHSDGTENVILLGAGMAHPLSRELAGNQQIQRNIKGAELRIFPEALDWKRGVVYLGGRNDAEVMEALQKLVKRFPRPNNLTFTIDAQAPGASSPGASPSDELVAPEEYVKRVRELYASRLPRKNDLTISDHMQQNFNAYLATGDERYVKSFDAMLKILFDNYRESLKFSANMPPSFTFHIFPQFVYLYENSPAFTAEDRRRAGELMRIVAEGCMNTWELVAPAQAYETGRNEYFTNHYAFASRSVGTAARYLLSRYNMQEMRYFLAVAEHTLNAAKEVPLSPEDAGGYQYLVYRIFCDYMLSTGKLDSSIFKSDKYRYYMDYAKMSMNHLGYTPGYGDANATGMRGGFVPMRENMEFTGDPEAAAILSLVGRNVEKGFYADKLKEWEIPSNLPLPHDPRFLGVRLFTVDATRAKILGLTNSSFPKLDKAFFRSSWNPQDAEFLAINGLNGAPHGHDDAIGVSQYVVGQHLWLTEGDYIRRAVEDHNLISVIRNGQAAMRQRNAIPAKERFAQVVGSAQSEDHQATAVTLLLENDNGINYYRHIGRDTGGGVWIIDELEAVQPGDYRFASRWRTTGEVQKTPQGALVKQKPANANDKLTNFSVAEGSGATRLGYSEFERSHGRGASNLSYNLSDSVTRTLLFWKDAHLEPGQRVFFANYFRVVPGAGAQPMEVQRLGDNAFAVGSGADRRIAVIGEFGGVAARALFAGPRGTLAIDPVKQDAAAIAKLLSQPGEVVKNATPALPQNVETTKLEALRQFEAEVSATASGQNNLAVGLKNGEFHLLKPDGSLQAKVKLQAEVTAIGAIGSPTGELWAVGTRPVQNIADGAGRLYLLDANGKTVWQKEIPSIRGRQGAPKTIFAAHLDGPDKPVSIIMGPESWRYTAFDLAGNERWFLEESIHGAMVGAAGDMNGDGRDEIYAGAEYYYHTIVGPDGKKVSQQTTSPRNYAAVIGDPGHKGINRVFAARSDGFLYSESLDAQKARNWSANLGGPAYGLVLQDAGIAAANINGIVSRVDSNGKRTDFSQLPAPLTDLKANGGNLFAPALDGRIYVLDPTTLKLKKAWETNGYSEADLYYPKLLSSGNALFATFGDRIYKIQ